MGLSPRTRAIGRHKRGTLNRTEQAYSAHLAGLQVLGQVEWFAFEALTLKLAADCRYTPDFLVMLPDGSLECHEVKGFWQDDAKVKIRCAAEKFPFRFVAVKAEAKKRGGGWLREEF